MKIRNIHRRGEDKIQLQMTPMIDIVFQLLVFFIMTFKIISPEGDFNIKMPLAAPSEGEADSLLPPIKVRLRATTSGELAAVQLGERTLNARRPFEELRMQIRQLVGDDSGPGSLAESTEIELDCDYQLKFENAIDAVTAISGYVDPDTGGIVKVIEKIKFSPPRGEQ